MKIDYQHEDYKERLPEMEKAIDCRKGQSAIHKKTITYLPKLKSQASEDYAAYLRRAPFFGASSRTIDAFQGLLLRKDPTEHIENPIFDNITKDGKSLYDFIYEVSEPELVEGCGGILVDYPQVDTTGMSRAEVEGLGILPFMALYRGKSIINWKFETLNNRKILVMIVLQEEAYIDGESILEQKEEQRWRVLMLEEGKYVQRLYRKGKKAHEFELIEESFPVMNGNRLNYIPFVFLGDCESLPPLIDLFDVNISHYQVTADYENGCHITGLPTPCVSGHTFKDGEKVYIGSNNLLAFGDPQAKAYYMEFSGNGLGELRENLRSKEKQMAVLGARMLMDDGKADKTATSTIIKSAGEFSVLGRIANSISNEVNRALEIFCEWAGLDVEKVNLSTDFLPTKMDAPMLTALLRAWQAGGISMSTLHANLIEGEILTNDTDAEKELIDEEGGSLGTVSE